MNRQMKNSASDNDRLAVWSRVRKYNFITNKSISEQGKWCEDLISWVQFREEWWTGQADGRTTRPPSDRWRKYLMGFISNSSFRLDSPLVFLKPEGAVPSVEFASQTNCRECFRLTDSTLVWNKPNPFRYINCFNLRSLLTVFFNFQLHLRKRTLSESYR